jgi:signal transduction histidine kinase
VARSIRSVDGAIARLALIVIGATALTAALPRLVAIDAITPLVAAAAFCVAALTRRRAPSIAWLASIVGAFAAAMVPIAQSRLVDPRILGIERWEAWAAVSGVAAVIAMWIAADYATRPDHRLDPAAVPVAGALVGWFVIAVLVAFGATLAGQRTDPAFTWYDVATAPIAAFSLFVAVLTALGAGADLRAALTRARTRLARAGSSTPATWTLLTETVRELTPGLAAAEAARASAERREIAGDLHASVVPSLRRAIEEAEGGADPTAVLRHLRAADLELERLMADRWPIVLETFGLVAALEDLAERLEASGSPPIEIEIERADGRPPRDVERAAWRFAQVTLDNAIRHAAAGAIDVHVATGPDAATMTIADDGAGLGATASHRLGSRGLEDAAHAAAAVGASTRVRASPEGGTTASFAWPAA